ncbi:ATP-binding protein [Gammaproteobacteria bacterium]|nr:ATP-binding protein [Gammaproteobacteria bacterium]
MDFEDSIGIFDASFRLEFMGEKIEEFLKSPEALERFETSLDRYLSRTGNLKIPLFYVDEDGLPLGRMLSCLFEKWERDDVRQPKETDRDYIELKETLAEIDFLKKRFFDPGLWPCWEKIRWRYADEVRTKGVNVFKTRPGAVPSVSEIGKSLNVFYILLYLFLVNKGRVSCSPSETENRLREIFPWKTFSANARGNESLEAVLKRCCSELSNQKDFDPYVKEVVLLGLNISEVGAHYLGTYYELVDSLDVTDPSALSAFLKDIEISDKRHGRFGRRAPECVTELLWDLGDVSDQEKVTVRGNNTQLLGSSLLKALDDKDVDQISAFFGNWNSPGEFNMTFQGAIAITKARLISELSGIRKIDVKLVPMYETALPETDLVIELPSSYMEVDADREDHQRYRDLAERLGGSGKGRFVDLEWIMLSTLLESLRPNARAITLVSDRVLYSTASKYLNLRRDLLQDFCVEHVISIEGYPEPQSEKKSNVLIFSRQLQQAEVRFSALRLQTGKETIVDDPKTRRKFQEWLSSFVALSSRDPQSKKLGNSLFNEFDKSQNPNLKVLDTWTESIEDIKEKQFTLLPRNLEGTDWGKFLKRVSELEDVRVVRLGELFEVIPSLISKPSPEEGQKEVPLLEISRIHEEVLRNERVVRLLPPRKLVMIPLNSSLDRTIHQDDITIAVKGTIGKVLRIDEFSTEILDGRKTYIGGVAASTISLLRMKSLTPETTKLFNSWCGFSEVNEHLPFSSEEQIGRRMRKRLSEYVVEILGFEGVKAWLRTVSLGTTIPYVTNKELLRLPIPIPLDGDVDERFLRACRLHHNRSTADHLLTLWNVLSGEHDPYQEFLESKEAKALGEFVSHLRSKCSQYAFDTDLDRDPLNPETPRLHDLISGKNQKAFNFDDASDDPLYEMRDLVFALIERGGGVAYEADSELPTGRFANELSLIDRHLLRSVKGLRPQILKNIVNVDDPLQRYGMWHEALSKIIGVETYWETRRFEFEQRVFNKDKQNQSGAVSYSVADAFWLLLGLSTYIEAEIERLCLDVSLEFTVVSKQLPLVHGSKLVLEITNTSNLSLRDVCLTRVGIESWETDGLPEEILFDWTEQSSNASGGALAPGESFHIEVRCGIEVTKQIVLAQMLMRGALELKISIFGYTPRFRFEMNSFVEYDYERSSLGFYDDTIYRKAPRISIPLNADVPAVETHISKDSLNPYIVGDPIRSKEMLFGRDDILSKIKQQLGSAEHQANPVLIEGNRRVGKTSILKELERSLDPDEIIPVYVSMHGADGSASGKIGLDTVEVFRLISERIGRTLNKHGIEAELPGEELTDPAKKFRPQFSARLNRVFDTSRPFEVFEQYIDEALDQIKPRKLLLMLDEFDKIHMGISSGVTSQQVPDNIRSLVHQYPSLSLIISGTKELTKIRGDYWSALFGLAVSVPVSALSAGEAARLVEEPARGMLGFGPRAVDEIVRVTAREPFLIQTLCTHLFGIAVAEERSSLDIDEVNRAAERMTEESNGHFRDLFWLDLKSDQQRLIYLSILKSHDHQPILGLAGIQSELFAMHVTYDEETLESDLEHLVELELVKCEKLESGTKYLSSVPLFERWVRQNIDEADLSERAAEQMQ